MPDPGRIVFLQRVLPHYRVGVFEQYSRRDVALSVVFGQKRPGEPLATYEGPLAGWMRPSRNSYCGRTSRYYWTDFRGTVGPGSTVIANAEISNLNIYGLLAARASLQCSVVLWTFGYDPVRGFDPRRDPRDTIRALLYEAADAVVFYWNEGREVVEREIGRRRKFFVAPNTLDTGRLFQIREGLLRESRPAVRRQLGLNERPHFSYVGRLVPDKEVERLLDAWAVGRCDASGWTLGIVGDGPSRRPLEERAQRLGLTGVRFWGAITDDVQVARHLFASDAILIPGRLGLAVVHAFCFGAPVISQAKAASFHGEGIGYLADGINGFLVPDGDSRSFAAAIRRIGESETVRDALSDEAVRTVLTRATVEHMIDGFESAATYCRGQLGLR